MTPPELAGYRPVSPAECLKWQIDNPGKSILVEDRGERYHHWFDAKSGCMRCREVGSNTERHITFFALPTWEYYIPEVTP